MHGWAYSLFPRYTHTHTRTCKLGLTFPGRSTQVSLQIPLLLELTLESELLFWAHIHPLFLQKGTTDRKHVITEVLIHMKVRRCCRNHRVSPHNWVQLLYQIEKKRVETVKLLLTVPSHQAAGADFCFWWRVSTTLKNVISRTGLLKTHPNAQTFPFMQTRQGLVTLLNACRCYNTTVIIAINQLMTAGNFCIFCCKCNNSG